MTGHVPGELWAALCGDDRARARGAVGRTVR